ncbi:MAG: hypothetical protein ACLTWO_10435, partial [Blautia massiliensis (ex Durand et al. 2017)]
TTPDLICQHLFSVFFYNFFKEKAKGRCTVVSQVVGVSYHRDPIPVNTKVTLLVRRTKQSCKKRTV